MPFPIARLPSRAIILLVLFSGSGHPVSSLAQAKPADPASAQAVADRRVQAIHTCIQLNRAERYQEALPNCELGLTLAQNEVPGTQQHARALSSLAFAQGGLGQHAKAIPLYLKAIEVRAKIDGPFDPEVQADERELALRYDANGQADKAEVLLRSILEKSARAGHGASTGHARTMIALAKFLGDRGDIVEAIAWSDRAIAALRKQADSQAHLASALSTRALLAYESDEEEQAIALYREALQMYQASVGKEDLRYATTLYHLGLTQLFTGRKADARKSLNESYDIWVRLFGADDPGAVERKRFLQDVE